MSTIGLTAARGQVETGKPALTRGMMMAWGVGTLGPVTVLTATNALLLRYMTDVYGLAAGVAASLIAVSKLYDVFADVACGVASDRTVSRFGRRRPYLILGAVLLAISVLAIFAGPAFRGGGARALYMGAILVFYATAYSIFNIPYMAMPGEMTDDYHVRTELMSWRVYAVAGAILMATVCGPMLLQAFGDGARAYLGMAMVFAPVIILAGVITFVGTRRAPSTARAALAPKFWAQARSVLANRPFVALILVKFISLMSLGLQSVFPFFFQRILRVPNAVLGEYFLSQSIFMLVSPPAWLWLSRGLGKKMTFLIALVVSIPVWASWWSASASDPLVFIFIRGAILGASAGGVILMGQSMLPDTMEYDRRRTGLRREGIFAAFYTTVEKLSGAIGVAILGAILSGAGYVQSLGPTVVQPPSALLAIRVSMAWLSTGITLASIGALMFYNLDEARLTATGRTDPPV